MLDGLGHGFPQMLEHLAGRLRRWLETLPDRRFAELPLADKLGRVLLMIAAFALVVGPLLWWWLG